MLVRVRVKTGARRETFMRVGPHKFEIQVKEKPEQNAANNRVLAILAAELEVPIKSIRFLSGQRSPSKHFEILNKD